jgi:Flp pilus assembly protein TadG
MLRVTGSRSRQSRSHQRPRRRGQALVEFALILPVFLLILSAVLDFGFLLYARMTVINATREGARVAVTAANPTTIPSIVQGQVIANSGGLVTGNVSVATTCVAIVSGSCNWSSTTSSQAGDAVRVTVSYDYQTFFPLLFGSTIDLASTVQMVRE